MSVDVAEKKDSYMDFAMIHDRKPILKINGLSGIERAKNCGGPQICR